MQRWLFPAVLVVVLGAAGNVEAWRLPELPGADKKVRDYVKVKPRSIGRVLAPPVASEGAEGASAARGGGGSPIPDYIVQCESGGDWNAQNPSSGAYGRFQIMPFHWSSGVCRGLGKDPAGQTECAARIWESSGPGAWECA